MISEYLFAMQLLLHVASKTSKQHDRENRTEEPCSYTLSSDRQIIYDEHSTSGCDIHRVSALRMSNICRTHKLIRAPDLMGRNQDVPLGQGKGEMGEGREKREIRDISSPSRWNL